MFILSRSVLGFLLLAGSTTFVSASDDWPQWRGLHRDGTWNDSGIMEVFPSGGLEVSWRVPVGAGVSSPVEAGGRVYVTDSKLEKPKAAERVLCFDEATGKSLWTFEYPVVYPDWAFAADQKGGPRSTPAVNEGRVYAMGVEGDVHCLDAKTGAVLWHRDLIKDYQVKEFGSLTASPVIDGSLVILFVGGKPGACLLALEKTTGKEIWKALDEDATHSTPILIEAGGARQLIAWTQQSVSSLDPASGKVLWSERLITSLDAAISSPVFSQEKHLLLIGGLMLKLTQDKPGATILWPENRSQAHRILSNTSTALIQGDQLYSALSNGEFVCLDVATGRQAWKTDKITDKKAGAAFHLTPNNGSVLVFNERGDLIRARLSPSGFEEMSRTHVIDPTFPFAGRKLVWTPAAYANQHILARNDVELIRASLIK